MAAYRPDNMRVHVDFKHYFDDSAAQLPQCVAYLAVKKHCLKNRSSSAFSNGLSR